MANEYRPWDESGETELDYFRRRFLEASAQAEAAEGELDWLRERIEAAEKLLALATKHAGGALSLLSRITSGNAAHQRVQIEGVLAYAKRKIDGFLESRCEDCAHPTSEHDEIGRCADCGGSERHRPWSAVPVDPGGEPGPETKPFGRCEGCGDEVQADHGKPGSWGHTRSEHHPDCDGSCFAGRCPVPVACGPVTAPEPESETAVLERLSALYTADEAKRWLNSPHSLLGGERPADLIRQGRSAEVLTVIGALETGAFL